MTEPEAAFRMAERIDKTRGIAAVRLNVFSPQTRGTTSAAYAPANG